MKLFILQVISFAKLVPQVFKRNRRGSIPGPQRHFLCIGGTVSAHPDPKRSPWRLCSAGKPDRQAWGLEFSSSQVGTKPRMVLSFHLGSKMGAFSPPHPKLASGWGSGRGSVHMRPGWLRPLTSWKQKPSLRPRSQPALPRLRSGLPHCRLACLAISLSNWINFIKCSLLLGENLILMSLSQQPAG